MADVESQQYKPMDDGSTLIKNAAMEVRLGFVRKVYGILTAQLLLTVAIATPMQSMPKQWFVSNMWLLQASLIGTIVAVCAISCCPSAGKTFPTNYLVLLAFTVCEAVLVGAVSAQYTAGTVCFCAAVTAVIFMSMTAYAWTTNADFTGAGPYMVGAMLALLTFGFGIGFLSLFGVHTEMLKMAYAAAGVLLFTLFIVYDTQLILGEYKGHKHSFTIDEYVFAALNLYLDIINLFMDLLRLLGDNR
mmetsp:Transcript_54307/g.150672  ORF Transcript_54307/g.150672 Transcript_54307/m.150672 type:complete len:246 (-) Transcript_54307:69-806(-)